MATRHKEINWQSEKKRKMTSNTERQNENKKRKK